MTGPGPSAITNFPSHLESGQAHAAHFFDGRPGSSSHCLPGPLSCAHPAIPLTPCSQHSTPQPSPLRRLPCPAMSPRLPLGSAILSPRAGRASQMIAKGLSQRERPSHDSCSCCKGRGQLKLEGGTFLGVPIRNSPKPCRPSSPSSACPAQCVNKVKPAAPCGILGKPGNKGGRGYKRGVGDKQEKSPGTSKVVEDVCH